VISSKAVFEMAEMAGFHFNLLDIGGGFPGVASAKPSFEEARNSYLYIHVASCKCYFS